MATHVSLVEASKLIGAGMLFMGLAAGLGLSLAHFGFRSREVDGPLRNRDCLLIALMAALLVFAYSMGLWGLDLFHPVMTVFFSAGGVVIAMTTRTKAQATSLRPK